MAKKNDLNPNDSDGANPLSHEQNMAKVFDNLVHEIMDGIEQNEDGSLIYGINFKFAPDGTPIFDGFEKIDTRKPEQTKIEPLIDIIEKKKEVVVIADLRCAAKEALDVVIGAGKLTIKIRGDTGKTDNTFPILVPNGVDPTKSTAKFNNGILEVRIRKGINTCESEYPIKIR